MKNKILTIVFIISLLLLLLTISIGTPIYCRFLYYIQIDTLNIEETTGYSYETIKEAYDQVLNFLTLPNREFGTGSLKYSESGMSHFVDCKKLFDLNISVLIISLISVVTLLVLKKFKKIELVNLANRTPYFYSGTLGLALPILLGLLISINFNKAFVIFHKIFFPGKDNWVFNSSTDEIINILPQKFFMNCAIVIGVVLVTLATCMIVYDYISRKKIKQVS